MNPETRTELLEVSQTIIVSVRTMQEKGSPCFFCYDLER
jgi:hypothetical protein